MNDLPVFLIGGAVIIAAAGYIFWPKWQQRLPKRKPMPPLVRRIPGLPVDGSPLDVYERYRLGQAEWALSRPTVPHPLEQSGDR